MKYCIMKNDYTYLKKQGNSFNELACYKFEYKYDLDIIIYPS